MRILQLFLLFTLFLHFIGGCGKEYSYEGGIRKPVPKNPSEEIVKSEWRFSEGTVNYFGPVDTAYLRQEGVAAVVTITGKTANGNQDVYIKLRDISGRIQKGKTYRTLLDEVKFFYKQGTDTLYKAVAMKGGDIYLTVSDYDVTRIIGTFKGLAKDKNDRSLSITNGEFSSPLKKAAPGKATGHVLFWADELCNGPINFKVGGKDGKITVATFFAECGDPEGVTLEMPPGTYNWVAYCGIDSVVGRVDIKMDDCAKVQVNFPIKPAPVTNTQKQLKCKVSDLQFASDLESTPYKRMNDVSTQYQGSSINILKYYLAVPAPPIPHEIAYEQNAVVIGPGLEREKRFITDQTGKVVEYTGPDNATRAAPADPFVRIKYFYDANDQMIKREVYDLRNHNLKTETTYTWQDGNIVRVLEMYPLSGSYSEINYTYFGRAVKAMPIIDMGAFELVLFQPLLNLGKPLKNIPKAKTVTTLGYSNTYDYFGYVVDNNGYVLAMTMSFNHNKRTDFHFKYKCF